MTNETQTDTPCVQGFPAAVVAAFHRAKDAMARESNDDEHEALWALVESLEESGIAAYAAYEPSEIVNDFLGWIVRGRKCPDEDAIDAYVKTARPTNSCPVAVKLVLVEWLEQRSTRRERRA